MADDRFSEDEIRRVFEQAAAAQARAGQDAPAAGLTLDEMAEAGAASGIPRAYIEAAARSVRRGVPESRRTHLGPLPTGVFRSVPLAEPPSNALWTRLVADARRTFDAQGRADTLGPDYEWRNGNLRMTLEPAGDGARLTLRSERRGNTAGLVTLAGIQTAFGVILLTASSAESGPPAGLGVVFLIFAAALLASAWTRQRRWANAREHQMTALTERASAGSVDAVGRSVARPDAPIAAPAAAPEPRLDLSLLGDATDTPDAAARRRDRA